jgi:hypothetical protein
LREAIVVSSDGPESGFDVTEWLHPSMVTWSLRSPLRGEIAE